MTVWVVLTKDDGDSRDQLASVHATPEGAEAARFALTKWCRRGPDPKVGPGTGYALEPVHPPPACAPDCALDYDWHYVRPEEVQP